MGICSKAWDGDKHTKVDACILNDKRETILVVQENKWRFDYDLSDPEPQLIAKAITAFDNNKNIPWQGVPILPLPRSSESKLMTGFTFTGTFPTFYKIPVSKDLFSVTNRGQPPGQETVVHAHFLVSRLSRNLLTNGIEICSGWLRLLFVLEMMFGCLFLLLIQVSLAVMKKTEVK
jgi:hypothetical protein